MKQKHTRKGTKGLLALAGLFVLLFFASGAYAQSRQITGVVSDAAGPMGGVVVSAQGTASGVLTDVNGRYAINAAQGQVLQFEFMGYEVQTVAVGTQSTINITLIESATGLDEAVAIGYGTARRRDLTGSVASVGGEKLAMMPVANAAQALQGQMAGVNIVTTDGRPDASVRIRVRGGGSITQSNDPLFIVDGFPVDNLSDVPSSQIATIDVLKDASSTAIYGARGANGVVIVTTKSPRGERLTVSYNGYVQLKTPAKLVSPLGGYDYVVANWEYATLFSGQSGKEASGWEQAAAIGNQKGTNSKGIDYYKTAPSWNPQERLLRDAFTHSHDLSVSGGTASTKYSVSANFIDDQGLKIESWYKRVNILAKIQQDLAKSLVLSVDARYTDSRVFGNESQGTGSGSRLTRALSYRPVDLIGDISAANTGLGMYQTFVSDDFDPKRTIEDIYNMRTRNRLGGNVALAWTPLAGLTLRSELGYQTYWNENYQFTGAYAKNTIGTEGGDADLTKNQGFSLRWANTVSYDVQGLGDDHRLNAMVGYEVNNHEGFETELIGKKYPESFDWARAYAMFNQYQDKNNSTMNTSQDVPDRMLSYFGRVNYTLKDRYIFTVTMRADGSSNFAPANRYGYFPAAAAAWRLSDEQFMKNISWLDDLKLRLSYGEAGNDRIDSNLWRMIWAGSTSLGYSYQNVQNSYFNPATTRLVNANLKWETTITRNVGVDFGFFKNRLRGTIDAYWNSTKDLLLPVNLPTYTGYATQMTNIGETSNRGVEISLSGDIVRKKDFMLSASFNIGFNKSRVEALTEEMSKTQNGYGSSWGGSSQYPTNDYMFAVGQPIGMIRGYVYDGFYTTDDFTSISYNPTTKQFSGVLKEGVPNSLPVTGPTPSLASAFPGMVKFKKMTSGEGASDKVGINETDDVRIIGDTNPKHTGGLTLNAVYKGFDVIVAFNWSYGNDIYNAQKLGLMVGNKNPFRNWHSDASGRYRLFDVDASGNLVPLTTMADLDRVNAGATTYMPYHEYNPVHSGAIEDGSFLRLNNLTVGYTLPEKVVSRIGIRKLRVYGTAYNLLTLTNYTGLDPEVDAGWGRNSNYPTPGLDFGAYPRSRTFTFGANITF